jgi:hypothetical protein
MRRFRQDVSRLRLLNAITQKMSTERWDVLEPHAEVVELRVGERIPMQPSRPGHIFFPTNSVCAMSSYRESGDSSEAHLIGNEGLIGIGWLLSGNFESGEALVQTGGYSLRFRSTILQAEYAAISEFRLTVLGHLELRLKAAMQDCFCYRHHLIGQQVAKILVLTSRRQLQCEVDLTHQSIATMLGVRREAVSLAAHELSDLGLIAQRRGHILICNPSGLADRACDCLTVYGNDYVRVAA